MKKLLLATCALTVLSVTAHAQSLIAPGQGTVTDADGTQWQIVPDGSILQTAPDAAQTWTPGGGGTSALTIAGGVVYGQDARTQDWLTLSGQQWTPSAAPSQSTQATATPPQTVQQNGTCTAPATATTAAGVASGGFHVVGGQIIGPSGQPFIAKGINVGDTNFGDAQTMLADFPGLNFIRVSDNAYSPPSTFASFVSTMTARGVVVEIEDHRASDGTGAGGEQGVVETGAVLAQEQAWFASLAQAFGGNPYVMLGTNNEPPGPGAALAQWIATTYQTVRSNGFTGILLMDAVGAFDTTGMPQNFAASFNNVAWDAHYYPWYYIGNNELAAQGLQQIVSSLQAIPSADGIIPVIVAEYGMCTSSGDSDQQGMALVEAVVRAAATSPQSTRGSAAWHWGQTDHCNNLIFSGSSPANDYTGAVQLYIGTDPTASPNASAQTATAANCASLQATSQAAAAAPVSLILQATPVPTVLAQAAPVQSIPPVIVQPTDPAAQAQLAGIIAAAQQAQSDLSMLTAQTQANIAAAAAEMTVVQQQAAQAAAAAQQGGQRQ